MTGKLRAYLVDDEPPALRRLTRLLSETGRVDVVGSASDPQEALRFLSLETEKPDVLFLDIQMPVLNGFDLLARLDWQPVVIFVTAYDQYALKAFEENAIDYLLKPVEPEQLARALAKAELWCGRNEPRERSQFAAAIEQISRLLREPPAKFPERIPVRVGERTQFLDLSRITHFFSEDRLTYAVADARNYCVDWPIADLEEKLDPAKFVRIHRAVLVNLDWVEELSPLFAGRLVVRLKDQKRTDLTVARDRARTLKTRLGL